MGHKCAQVIKHQLFGFRLDGQKALESIYLNEVCNFGDASLRYIDYLVRFWCGFWSALGLILCTRLSQTDPKTVPRRSAGDPLINAETTFVGPLVHPNRFWEDFWVTSCAQVIKHHMFGFRLDGQKALESIYLNDVCQFLGHIIKVYRLFGSILVRFWVSFGTDSLHQNVPN